MTIELPLFPLGSVLFPGVVLPLHIFEDRYRQLVRDLAALPEGAPRRFGVVAIKDGHALFEVGGADRGRESVNALYDTGCTAEIDSIVEYEDGRFDITTTGVHRFRLREYDGDGPYAQGVVELMDEVAGPEAEMLRRYITMIQVRRQDFNGRMLTIRRDDHQAIAAILGTGPDAAPNRLDELGVSYRP